MTRDELRTELTPRQAMELFRDRYTGSTGLYVMDGVECAFYQPTTMDYLTASKLMEKAGTVDHWHWAGKTATHTLDFRIGSTTFSCTLNKPEEASK